MQKYDVMREMNSTYFLSVVILRPVFKMSTLAIHLKTFETRPFFLSEKVKCSFLSGINFIFYIFLLLGQ